MSKKESDEHSTVTTVKIVDEEIKSFFIRAVYSMIMRRVSMC